MDLHIVYFVDLDPFSFAGIHFKTHELAEELFDPRIGESAFFHFYTRRACVEMEVQHDAFTLFPCDIKEFEIRYLPESGIGIGPDCRMAKEQQDGEKSLKQEACHFF